MSRADGGASVTLCEAPLEMAVVRPGAGQARLSLSCPPGAFLSLLLTLLLLLDVSLSPPLHSPLPSPVNMCKNSQ